MATRLDRASDERGENIESPREQLLGFIETWLSDPEMTVETLEKIQEMVAERKKELKGTPVIRENDLETL